MKQTKEQIQKTRAQQDADITQCLKVLSDGGLILYPTDTVWGIGCDATNTEAVNRVYRLKQRDDSKALIVLIDSAEHLDHYVVDVPPIARPRTCWVPRTAWAYASPTTSSATACVSGSASPSYRLRPT